MPVSTNIPWRLFKDSARSDGANAAKRGTNGHVSVLLEMAVKGLDKLQTEAGRNSRQQANTAARVAALYSRPMKKSFCWQNAADS